MQCRQCRHAATLVRSLLVRGCCPTPMAELSGRDRRGIAQKPALFISGPEQRVCSMERGCVMSSRCVTAAPSCEATRCQNPTEPRREQLFASGEPQKLPHSHSLLLRSLGEVGDKDPEKAAVLGQDSWERVKRILQEPREHSNKEGIGRGGQWGQV